MKRYLLTVAALLSIGGIASAQQAMTIDQAIARAVKTSPRVGEAAANRRAVDHEVRQSQGRLLPQVRIEAKAGYERYRTFDGLRSPTANKWRDPGAYGTITVSQLIFDGMGTVNEIYRQIARSDAASWRTFERSELVALDAAESYIDIVRYTNALTHAKSNVAIHARLERNVSQRYAAGRSGSGNREQVQERLRAAEALSASISDSLENAKATFRSVVGVEPGGLRFVTPAYLSSVPANRSQALAITIKNNPTLRAANSDVKAAWSEYNGTSSLFSPRVSLEGVATRGKNAQNYVGAYDVMTAKVRLDWSLFSGGSDIARRNEARERVTEQKMRMENLRRDAFRSVDSAWSARTNTLSRAKFLERQVMAAKKVVSSYKGEYELGNRTLLDLLNAQNSLVNAQIALESAKSVSVFADYQLLATTGMLLARLGVPLPKDAKTLSAHARGVFPANLIPEGGPLDMRPKSKKVRNYRRAPRKASSYKK